MRGRQARPKSGRSLTKSGVVRLRSDRSLTKSDPSLTKPGRSLTKSDRSLTKPDFARFLEPGFTLNTRRHAARKRRSLSFVPDRRTAVDPALGRLASPKALLLRNPAPDPVLSSRAVKIIFWEDFLIGHDPREGIEDFC